MNIQVEIKPIGFKVLEEKDVISEDLDIIECVMEVEFSININEVKKATYTERIKATYFNTMTGVEMDEARDKAINEYINNLTVTPEPKVEELIIQESPIIIEEEETVIEEETIVIENTIVEENQTNEETEINEI